MKRFYPVSIVASAFAIIIAVGLPSGNEHVSAATVRKTTVQNDAACVKTSIMTESKNLGALFSANMKVKNTGKATWNKKDYGIRISYADTAATTVALPKDVASQKTEDFVVFRTGPTKKGTYPFKWQMTYKGKVFGEACRGSIIIKENIKVTSSVASQSSKSSSSKVSSAKSSSSSSKTSVVPAANTQVQQSSSIQTYVAPAASPVSSAYSVSSVSSAAQISSSQQSVIASSSSSSTAPVAALVNTGNLYVTQGMVFGPQQLLGGKLEDAVLNLNFTADTNEDIDVTDLQISISAANTFSIDRLELYMDGASTPFTIASVGGCGTDTVPAGVKTYCANMEAQQLVIAKGLTKNVNVRPRMNTDDNGAVSGEQFSFFIDANVGAVKARGTQSSNNLAANDQDTAAEGEVFIGTNAAAANVRIAGALNTVVLAKLASITNANPDADGTLTPTGLYPVGQFTFTAMTNTNTMNGLNKWTLDTIIFTGEFFHTTLHGYDFFVYNKADTSTKAKCVLLNFNNKPAVGAPTMTVTNGGMIRCENLAADPVATSLGSGESMTLVLEANILETIGTEQTNLQFYLNRLNDAALTVVHPLKSHIQWIDEDTTQKAYTWAESSVANTYSTKYVK